MNHSYARFRLLPTFLRWYLWDHPAGGLFLAWRYAVALLESFSVIFLAKTLLSPWKNILDDGQTRSIEQKLEAWSLNLLSRGVGCVVRLGAIIAGIAASVFALLVGLALAALWYALPVVILSLPYLFLFT